MNWFTDFFTPCYPSPPTVLEEHIKKLARLRAYERADEMRNAMLKGGHSWEDTKAAVAAAYPGLDLP